MNIPRCVRSGVAALLACVLILALAPSLLAGGAARTPKFPWEGPTLRVKPSRLVVTFRRGTSASQKRSIHAAVGGQVVSRGRARAIDVVRLPRGRSSLAAIRAYEADPNVVAAEPDRFAVPALIPDDPRFTTQWGLNNTGQSHPITESGYVAKNNHTGTPDADVDAPEAWDASTADAPGPADDVVVAVIDTGVDVDHPDLADAMWVNTVEEAGVAGVDDDGNGYVDDVNGWDFVQDNPDPSPGRALDASHGTHVAGVVAAERDDATGIAGVCQACRIMGLRMDLSLGQEIDAIEYAVDNGADIINMSFASGVWSAAERTAIRTAGNAGVLTVAAASNSSADNDIPIYVDFSFAPAFPASYNLESILSVAATTHRDQYALQTECDLSTVPRWRCAFTSWGHDSVDVAAPGVDIVSTIRADVRGDLGFGYDVWDGTSMAAPLVAGIAGAVKHEHLLYTPVELKNAVMNSVDSPPSLKMLTSLANVTGVPRSPIAGRFTRTQGRVNALAALDAPVTNATPLTDGNIDGATPLAASVNGRVLWPGDVNDVYERRLVAGNRYRIVLNGPAGADMDLWVWNPGAREIHQFSAGCFNEGGSCPALKAVSGGADADERVTFGVNKTGDYFIQVQGWYSGGRYALSVRRV